MAAGFVECPQRPQGQKIVEAKDGVWWVVQSEQLAHRPGTIGAMEGRDRRQKMWVEGAAGLCQRLRVAAQAEARCFACAILPHADGGDAAAPQAQYMGCGSTGGSHVIDHDVVPRCAKELLAQQHNGDRAVPRS